MMPRFLYRAGLPAAVLLAGVLAVPAWAQVESVPGSGAPVRFLPADEVERHLPQSSVYAIVEDQQGFLWFATREGVGRWDGYEMRTWKHDPFDDASLPGNVVRAGARPLRQPLRAREVRVLETINDDGLCLDEDISRITSFVSVGE